MQGARIAASTAAGPSVVRLARPLLIPAGMFGRAPTRRNQHGDFVTLLGDIGSQLLTADTVPDAVRFAFERLSGPLGLDVFLCYRLTADGAALDLIASAGITPAQAARLARLPLGNGVCGAVAVRVRPIAVSLRRPGAAGASARFALVRDVGLSAYVCHPLLGREGLVGTLAFGSRARARFLRRELQLVRTVAQQVAFAAERIRLVDALRESASRLRESDRRKDEFLATLAHELRNPLAPIRFALQLLDRPGLTAEAEQHARGVIGRQVAHMVRLMDDLLDVSRITRNKIQLRPEPTPLAVIMQAALESAGPGAAAAGHRPDLEEAPPDLFVRRDARRSDPGVERRAGRRSRVQRGVAARGGASGRADASRTPRRACAIPPPAGAGRRRQRRLAEMRRMLVETMGHEAHAAHEGETAVMLVERHRPDVVLLDIGLPGMRGYEVARRIRARVGRRVHLAAITGWGQQEDRRRAREAGVDVHFTKPADPSMLRWLLASVAERSDHDGAALQHTRAGDFPRGGIPVDRS